MTSPARVHAVKALGRITDAGAYSNVLVAKTSGLSREDHAHYQRLVYSSLRWLPYADRVIEKNTRGRRLDLPVRALLRTAVIDSVILGTPDHAVVSEYVECARAVGSGRASGFVNAVLRAFVGSDPVAPDSIADAYPAELLAILERSLGDGIEVFLEGSNKAAPVGVWESDPIAATIDGIPGARYLERGEDPFSITGGVVIDPASAAVALAVEAKAGDRVADVAAAPGGKTAILAHATGEQGMVVASDIHGRRVQTARKRLPSVSWLRADGRMPPFQPGSFDRVLLDAPCTGLGTLRRRPEIRFRVDSGAPERYGRLQRELLESATRLVRPGGRLVYSVCTVTKQETTDVVHGLGFKPPDGVPGDPVGDGVMLAPHTTGTDGMFIAVLDA